jgi:hypothetical protein
MAELGTNDQAGGGIRVHITCQNPHPAIWEFGCSFRSVVVSF